MIGEDAGDRQKNKCRCDVAGMQMLIGKIKGRARDGQGQHGSGESDACPLHAHVFEEESRNAPATENNEQNCYKLKQELRDCDGDMGQTDEGCDNLVEERRLQLDSKELGIMRVERGVEIAFYRGEIDTVVFEPGVITHHHEGQNRKEKYQQETTLAKTLE